jgi:hypothetical protein
MAEDPNGQGGAAWIGKRSPNPEVGNMPRMYTTAWYTLGLEKAYQNTTPS